MPTWRRFARKAYQCGRYEAQDVLVETGDVDLISIDVGKRFDAGEYWLSRLVHHGVSSRLLKMNPGLQRVRLTHDYDLFVAVCQSYEDLLYINAIDGWKDRCRTSVCWVDEIWAASIPEHRHWLKAFNQFDHVFIGLRGSVGVLSAALGRPCHWLPGAVDAMRFTPFPTAPRRVIDVFSLGRRYAGVHEAILELAARSEMFYVYDTARTGVTDTFDHRQHRDYVASVAKRSRYFLVAPAKMDASAETKGQIEVGTRYLEGAAAGGVMLGRAPDCESFRLMLGWPDAVIEIEPDGSNAADVLRSLSSQRERLDEISRRNAAEALLRHDWIYRWKQILDVAGIEPPAGMLAREQQLKELAQIATENGSSGTQR